MLLAKKVIAQKASLGIELMCRSDYVSVTPVSTHYKVQSLSRLLTISHPFCGVCQSPLKC